MGRLDLDMRDIRAGRDLSAGDRVAVEDGDLEAETPGTGLVVSTPDGSAQYRIRVDNSGTLTTEQI